MVKMKKKIFLLYISAFFAASSCKTSQQPSQLNYMQNVDQIAAEASQRNIQSTIQRGDQLTISVTAKNMDVVRPFNQSYYNSQSSATMSSPSVEKLYLVDSEGNIDFPILGKLSTNGKTVELLKSEMSTLISKYVISPNVTVRLSNFKVTLLGEVNRPGQYTIAEGQATLLNAIGLAGDLSMFGKREDILLVRNVDGDITKARINLMDDDFINSPYYNLKQGDVIYVSATPTKDKTARLDPNTNIYIAVAGTIIGLAGIFITIFKK